MFQRLRPVIQRTRYGFHSSSKVLAKVTEVVPALGESITEGSIQTWTKSVGEMVAVDDVVVIVETDKVTVDIKSTQEGVLTAILATGDEVAVGQPLYELDTEGSASVTSSSTSSAAKQENKVVTAESASVPAPTSKPHGRVPLIKFLGKRSLIKAPVTTKPFPSASVVIDNSKKRSFNREMVWILENSKGGRCMVDLASPRGRRR